MGLPSLDPVFEALEGDTLDTFELELQAIMTNQGAELLKVWALLPDEVWERYKGLSLKKAREVQMLIEAKRAFRKAIRPIIRKHAKTLNKTAEQNSDGN